MKKSSILSVATVAAVVATSVGSYAAWDSLTASTKTNVTIAKSTTVNTQVDNLVESSDRSGDQITYEGTLTVNIEDKDSFDPSTLQFVPTAKVDNNVITAQEGTIELLEGSTPLSNNIDTIITETNTYKVKLTANKSLAGKTVEVSVDVSASK